MPPPTATAIAALESRTGAGKRCGERRGAAPLAVGGGGAFFLGGGVAPPAAAFRAWLPLDELVNTQW